MSPKPRMAGSVTLHPAHRSEPSSQPKTDTQPRLSPGLVIHISDTLGDARRGDLENALNSRYGINMARFNASRPHLLLVDYDPTQINSLDILHQVRRQNVRAQLIGPI